MNGTLGCEIRMRTLDERLLKSHARFPETIPKPHSRCRTPIHIAREMRKIETLRFDSGIRDYVTVRMHPTSNRSFAAQPAALGGAEGEFRNSI